MDLIAYVGLFGLLVSTSGRSENVVWLCSGHIVGLNSGAQTKLRNSTIYTLYRVRFTEDLITKEQKRVLFKNKIQNTTKVKGQRLSLMLVGV